MNKQVTISHTDYVDCGLWIICVGLHNKIDQFKFWNIHDPHPPHLPPISIPVRKFLFIVLNFNLWTTTPTAKTFTSILFLV